MANNGRVGPADELACLVGRYFPKAGHPDFERAITLLAGLGEREKVIMTPQDFAMLLNHERRVLDMAYMAYMAAQNGRMFTPWGDDERMARRLVDIGFLASYGSNSYVPTGPNISFQEGVV